MTTSGALRLLADRALSAHAVCDESCPVRSNALCLRKAAAEIDELLSHLLRSQAEHASHVATSEDRA